jgi:hypothetical protein
MKKCHGSEVEDAVCHMEPPMPTTTDNLPHRALGETAIVAPPPPAMDIALPKEGVDPAKGNTNPPYGIAYPTTQASEKALHIGETSQAVCPPCIKLSLPSYFPQRKRRIYWK